MDKSIPFLINGSLWPDGHVHSPGHGGAGRFFSPFSNQSDDGAIKRLTATQEIDENCLEKQPK